MGADRADGTEGTDFGPYIVFERLGVGGMATVHRARERGIAGFERTVALKRLLPHLAEDDEFITSFVREAQFASLLQHGNIAQLYELGRVADVYFIAMEFVDGKDLRRCLKQARRAAGPPSLEFTLSVLMELCDALDYAHGRTDDQGRPLGLVHRDISPSNLLVSAAGHLKIIDFGIAKATAGHEATRSGAIKGKLAYMAPEALTGNVDARADLFSAGVVAHELLSAKPLFADKNDFKVIHRIQHYDPPAPSGRNPECPKELDAIVLKALAKNPENRWQSARSMLEALRDFTRRHNLLPSRTDVVDWIEYAFSLPPDARKAFRSPESLVSPDTFPSAVQGAPSAPAAPPMEDQATGEMESFLSQRLLEEATQERALEAATETGEYANLIEIDRSHPSVVMGDIDPEEMETQPDPEPTPPPDPPASRAPISQGWNLESGLSLDSSLPDETMVDPSSLDGPDPFSPDLDLSNAETRPPAPRPATPYPEDLDLSNAETGVPGAPPDALEAETVVPGQPVPPQPSHHLDDKTTRPRSVSRPPTVTGLTGRAVSPAARDKQPTTGRQATVPPPIPKSAPPAPSNPSLSSTLMGVGADVAAVIAKAPAKAPSPAAKPPSASAVETFVAADIPSQPIGPRTDSSGAHQNPALQSFVTFHAPKEGTASPRDIVEGRRKRLTDATSDPGQRIAHGTSVSPPPQVAKKAASKKEFVAYFIIGMFLAAAVVGLAALLLF